MAISNVATVDDFGGGRGVSVPRNRSDSRVVSWSAITAGAAAAAALSLILLILGTGLGLSAISPWSDYGIGAATFGLSTILWITFTQVIASVLGGYLAGRLRRRWADVNSDEVYFRDTAHGLLAWAVATLATAVLVTSVIGSIVKTGTQAGATVAGGVAATALAGATAGAAPVSDTSRAEGGGSMAYLLDSLFRKDNGAGKADSAANGNANEQGSAMQTAEVGRIFMNTVRSGPLPAEDLRYVAQVVAQRTGLSQADAEVRVTEIYTQAQTKMQETEVAAREAADKARKASAYAALWLFLSLMIGAFAASLSATFGGRRRDASSAL